VAPVTCPFCYYKQDSAQLHHVCTGHAAPGMQPCTEIRDDERQQRTGYAMPAMPTFPPGTRIDAAGRAYCPECGASCGERACTACHTPLPRELLEGHSPLLGMVGRTSSGKTVYLTVLNQQLRLEAARRFDAEVHLRGDHQAGMHSVQEWLDQYEKALFDRKELLPPTPPGRRVPLVLQMRQKVERRWRRAQLVSTVLSFCDVAGEDLLTQPRAMRQPYLAAADGLIVLLDAWQIPKVRARQPVPPGQEELRPLVQSVLSIVTDTLRDARTPQKRGRLTIPMAVVVGKFDVVERVLPVNHYLRTAEPSDGRGYDETFGSNVSEHLRKFLDSHGAEDVDRHMALNYTTYRYFAVSSLGAAPVQANGRQEVDAGGVRPRHVTQPLLWLLYRHNIIRRTGR
jgi:hypothetical protein